MTRCTNSLLGLLTASALCLPSASVAQMEPAKEAIVVSTFGLAADPISRDVRDDALAVSEELLGLGYNVRRFENPEAAVLQDAIAAADGDDLVVYYAGTEAVLLPELTEAVASVSSASAAVFLDMCRAERVLGDIVGSAWTLPDKIPENVFVASAIAPDAPCGVSVSPVAARLFEGLSVPGLTLDMAFAASDDDSTPVWTTSTLSAPFVFRQPASDMRLTSEDYALLDTLSEDAQAQMIALWTQAGIAVDRSDLGTVAMAPVQRVVQDTIVLSAPVQPVRSNVTFVQPRSSTGTLSVSDGISVIAAAPVQNSENRAVPGVGGLPTPSIIVGLLATNASFGTVTEDTGALSGSELDYTNFEARRAMREEDPTLFSSLIETGAFDPPPAELVFAIQSELTRMECYSAGIDGRWGGGSEAGMRRYYQEIDETPENLQPTLASFHQMLLRDDVTCPPVAVAAAPRASTSTAATPRRQQQAAAPAAPRRQAAPAAPAAQPSRTFNSNSGVTGVFR